jgi:hypothetical protein
MALWTVCKYSCVLNTYSCMAIQLYSSTDSPPGQMAESGSDGLRPMD